MHAYSYDKIIIIYIDYHVRVVDRAGRAGTKTEIINHLSKQRSVLPRNYNVTTVCSFRRVSLIYLGSPWFVVLIIPACLPVRIPCRAREACWLNLVLSIIQHLSMTLSDTKETAIDQRDNCDWMNVQAAFASLR